jgi:hypothetical protein
LFKVGSDPVDPENGDFGKFDAPNPTGRVNLLNVWSAV